MRVCELLMRLLGNMEDCTSFCNKESEYQVAEPLKF